ncbi:hypothetical protein IAE22_31845, partial [Bacillus sp. S34]|nr:hypothetical protein [Bacillus sp. S34]
MDKVRIGLVGYGIGGRAFHRPFLLDAEGDAFTLLTTHLDHEVGPHGDEVRAKSAALIVERLSTTDGPVVVAERGRDELVVALPAVVHAGPEPSLVAQAEAPGD